MQTSSTKRQKTGDALIDAKSKVGEIPEDFFLRARQQKGIVNVKDLQAEPEATTEALPKKKATSNAV